MTDFVDRLTILQRKNEITIMELYQDIYGSNTIAKRNVYSPDVKIEYLMHQYPWFTREQIVEAVEKEDHQIGKILATLDRRSGSYPEMYGF